jgi:beta-glucosidase
MKNILTYLLLIALLIMLQACGKNKKETATANGSETERNSQPNLGYRSAPLIKVDELQFKDLNRNGQLDKYEDWRLTPAERS